MQAWFNRELLERTTIDDFEHQFHGFDFAQPPGHFHSPLVTRHSPLKKKATPKDGLYKKKKQFS